MNIYILRFHRISKVFLYRPYYDNQRAWLRVSGFQTTGTAIQNPFTFYYVQNNDWSSSHSYQFWNKNFTTAVGVNNEETLKTIYSPSLSGFVEPKTAAFTGFTSTGGESSNSSQFNVSGSFTKGYSFYTNGWKIGETIYFDALGYRNTYNNSTGNVANVTIQGHFWTSGSSSKIDALYLRFYSITVHPQRTSFRSFGLSCRSVKE